MDPEVPVNVEDPPPPAAPAGRVAAIQIKLPPFWPKDPALWFAQIKAQFTTRGITASRTKFKYVVSSLSPDYVIKVRDLLLTPPTEHPYEQLKKELTNRTSVSEQRRLQQQLTSKELGDRKPSQLLRHIQQLLGDKANTMDATFLRELFLQYLSSTLQLARVPMPMCSDTVLCDISTGTPRPFVPENFRRTVFDSLHCLSHPGI